MYLCATLITQVSQVIYEKENLYHRDNAHAVVPFSRSTAV